MSAPPLLMRLRVRRAGKGPSLWLPLFLILPILFGIALALSPIILIVASVLWYRGRVGMLLRTGPAIVRCICTLRGLEVNVTGEREQVQIYFR